MAELVEDRDRLPAGGVRRRGVAARLVDAGEAGEGDRLVEAVAEAAVQVHAAPVAGGALGVVAEVVVDVAEAVPGVRLRHPVAELLLQAQRLRAAGERLL